MAVLRFDKDCFFHHFNPKPKPNYSIDEVRFEIEIKGSYKAKKLTDKKLLKPTKYLHLQNQ